MIDSQTEMLINILSLNTTLMKLLAILDKSGLDNYYVAAGCINQTVFNYLHGYDLEYGINDYDIVYYDNDTSYQKEDKIIKKLSKLLKDLNIKCDIKNEARVYLWYYEKYGKKIDKYSNLEEAINSWGSTVTCIGVRYEKGKLKVYAPYGLNDLFDMIIRPVKTQITKENYIKKVTTWKSKWPKLTVIDWD